MGVLSGYKVVEFAGIGPAPMCAMLLSDMGAEVLRLDRAEDADLGVPTDARFNLLGRGRRSVAIDLKKPEGTEAALKLIEQADALIEGFRPGVMERLGLSPEVCLARNPRLVFGRMTGWGQEGPLANAVGHDINYIALVGALHSIGRKGEAPLPPLNLVGDFGGGGVFLALVWSVPCWKPRSRARVRSLTWHDRRCGVADDRHLRSARGRQVDGQPWGKHFGHGAHYYNVYETSDGQHLSIGSIEAKFYAELLRLTGLEKDELPRQNERASGRR